MENEQMNLPTYDLLVLAYTTILQENDQLRKAIDAAKTDRSLERVSVLVDILTKLNGKEEYKKIVKDAQWHLEQMLKKPTK